MVTKHPNSIYVLAAAPRQPLEIIQAPTYGFAPANALTNVTRNASLTFGGNGSTNLASVTVNGQATALYRDQTFATTTALALVSGSNAFTVVAVDTAGAALTNQFSAALPVTQHLTYDLNGNLTSDGTRGFAYDNIGNRITAQFGGDTNGSNLKIISYTANSLNQYTGIVTPGLQDVCGAALATNAVTVNGGLADRHGEYFHRQISVANTNQPVWQNVTNIAGTFTNKGGSVFPANAPTLAYDADGNLTFDGVWNYQWDGENRLVAMTMTNVAGIANSNRLQLQFAYDYQGRRIQKGVYQWNGSSFGTNPVSQVRFVYDGWNLLAEIATNNATVRSYMWGQDLSRTMDQSGGVGGLLMASISGTNCFVTYDGNVNITALINAIDKSLVGRYEYTPYGELLRETGLLSHQNPFRFSTKFRDEESGLIYYGVRYLNPAIARWISKDPSEENGGLNLYVFVNDSPNNFFDTFGEHPNDQYYGYGDDPAFRQFLHGIKKKYYVGRDLTEAEIKEISEEFSSGAKGSRGQAKWKRDLREGGGRGRGAMLIGAIFLLASVVDGVAAGNDDPNAVNLVGDFKDLQRDIKSGDQAWADLDSAVMAADVQNMGSDEAALWVWEAVQQ